MKTVSVRWNIDTASKIRSWLSDNSNGEFQVYVNSSRIECSEWELIERWDEKGHCYWQITFQDDRLCTLFLLQWG